MNDLSERQGRSVFYTWAAQAQAVPLHVVSGEGARFRTADGGRWIDLGSMTWNANLGHDHPAMRGALARAAARGLLATPSAVFPDKARAGELLAEIAPRGLAKSFICLSGAEANENAVKMARLFTGRRKIVARDRGYHGATLAMLSLSGDPRRNAFEPGLPDVVHFHDPYAAEPCAGDLDETLRAAGPDTVAAVLLEGVVGANGVLVPPPGYWRRIRSVCDAHGVLLIADEVLSGFGRTGRWFAVDHDGVSPDIVTCAKGLTGGYAPGGAVIVSQPVARFFDDHVLSCGLTAYAHPLTCAAIVAAVTAYRDEGLIENAAGLGAWLRPRLEQLARGRTHVREVRGLGLLWALDLDADAERMARLAAGLRRRHLHMHKRDNLLYLAPPLVVTREDLDEALALLSAALDEAWA